MDIYEFHADLIASVNARADSSGIGTREAFVEEMSDRLLEAGELADIEPCIEQIVGPRQRRLAVDAYAIDEADNSLNLVIAIFEGNERPEKLALSEAKDRGFSRLLYIYDASVEGWVTSNVEESRPLWALAGQISKEDYSALRLHIFSDRPLSERVRSIPDTKTSDGMLVTYQVWDLTRLKRIFDAKHVRDDLEVDLSELPGGGLTALKATQDDDEYDAYLAVIPGRYLAEIYVKYGSRLLEGNVRTYLGRRGNVNKGIQKTLQENPERFFAYNNGIAVTASSIEVSEMDQGTIKITSATDLQIVNGAQTTASLAAALRDKNMPEVEIFVPVKLSVVNPDLGDELIPLISRFANSQNAVRASDFFANHPFHRRIEEMSRRILAPAMPGSQVETHWYYERARGQYLNDQNGMTYAQKKQFVRMNPKHQVIKKTDLAKTEIAFEGLPDVACKGAEKAFVTFADRISKNWTDDDNRALYTDDWFKKMAVRSMIFRTTERTVSNSDWYEGGYRAQVVAYTCARLSLLANEVSNGGQLDYRRLWNIQRCGQEVITQIDKIAERMMAILLSPPREGQNVGEWSKQQACREVALKKRMPVVNGFESWLIDASEKKSQKKEAKFTGQVDDDLRCLQQVLAIPSKDWKSARAFARQNSLIMPDEETPLRRVCERSSRPPSEKQAHKLMILLTRIINAGWESNHIGDWNG